MICRLKAYTVHEVNQAVINSLWPIDVICRQGSGSTLAQVMACCLATPSHYLNQCWQIIREISDIHIRAISQEMPQPVITKIRLKITYLKFHSHFPGANELIQVIACRLICLRNVTITNTDILWNRPFGKKNTVKFEFERKFSFKNMYLKISSTICRPFWFGLNMLRREDR